MIPGLGMCSDSPKPKRNGKESETSVWSLRTLSARPVQQTGPMPVLPSENGIQPQVFLLPGSGQLPINNLLMLCRHKPYMARLLTGNFLVGPDILEFNDKDAKFIVFALFCSFWRARGSKQQIVFLWNYLFNFGRQVQPQWEVYHDQGLSDCESLGSQHGKPPHWDLPGTELHPCLGP